MIEFVICEDQKELCNLYKKIIDKNMMEYDVEYKINIFNGYNKEWKKVSKNNNFKI